MDFNNLTEKEYVEYIQNVKDTLLNFLDFVETIKERYYKNKDIDVEMLKKQNDLLHDIELDDLTYHEIARLGKAIRELRRNRREYKNDYLYHESIKEFAKDQSNISNIRSLISLLDNLCKNIVSDVNYVNNQKYNTRSHIDNITTMKIGSTDENDARNEDIILLNRVLNKYAVNVETIADKKNLSKLYVKLQLENSFSLKIGKKIFAELKDNIEKFYKPRQQSIMCKLTTSDMCLNDEFGKNELSGVITIYLNDEILYDVYIVIREGKNNTVKKKDKKKGKRKRR